MICIIPARGGSKRIVGKNIKDFLGKPLIAYSIEAALNSKVFSEVIVSTDDEAIANVAREFGASVPFFREASLSDDYATSTDVIKDAIRRAHSSFSGVCCLYATAPLVTAEILKEAAGEFKKEGCKFLFSATAFDFPIQRAIKLDESARVSMFYPQFEKTRSQDLEPAFHDAGAFYFGKRGLAGVQRYLCATLKGLFVTTKFSLRYRHARGF